MNNVSLIGRLTRDPELRTTASGISTCRFSLAVDGRPDSNGNPHTDFINIVVWRNQTDNVAKYCKKWSQVAVTGRIQTGSYQGQDGNTRYTTDVVADRVQFLGSKNSSSNGDNYQDEMPDYSMGDQSSTQGANLEEDPFKDFGTEVVLSDDDLLF